MSNRTWRLLAGCGLALAACSPPQPAKVEAPLQRQASVAKPALEPCSPGATLGAARAGTSVSYQTTTSSGQIVRPRLQNLVLQAGDVTLANRRITRDGADLIPNEPHNRFLGFLPGPASLGAEDRGERDVRYPPDAAEKVKALRPGQTAVLAGTETSLFGGDRKTIPAEAKVTFAGCTTLVIQGRRESAMVYDVASQGRTYDERAKTDGVMKTWSRYYVSPRLGWWLREDSEGGSFTQAILISQGAG